MFYILSILFAVFEAHILHHRLTGADPGKAPKPFLIMAASYSIWTICGLFTSAWIPCALLILVGLATKRISRDNAKDGKKEPHKTKKMVAVYTVDAVICVALLAYVFVSHFLANA